MTGTPSIIRNRRRRQEMTERISAPSHRHAAPSGPWPWMDLESDSEFEPTQQQELSGRPKCLHADSRCVGCWAGYPQSLFPNWTPRQVKRSEIERICARSGTPCVLHHIDVGEDARFSEAEGHTMSEAETEEFWEVMQQTKRPDNNRVRALFIENLSMPLLQMLGTKYNIEPFFFTSALNWIPSRYQENVQPEQGDHITITLTFLRAKKVKTPPPSSIHTASTVKESHLTPEMVEEVIDTQRPLSLRSHDLHLDLLAVHMVRTPVDSTIISYHPSSASAQHLHSRVRLAGESVYWQHIFRKTSDPTFVLLTILWYALYAWDQALETLWEHICQLELDVMKTNDMDFTQELHIIRAHLLHYTSLLEDFRKSVRFVLDTYNPAMDAPSHDSERARSKELLKTECDNLLMQIERLQMSRGQQDKRLKNVMNLVFSSVNINDSKHMQEMTKAALKDSAAMKVLTEAAVRDSAAMKQVAYLTMIFMPASFVAGVFGMNIREINPDALGSLAHYVEAAFPLTAVTIWVVVAFQGKWTSPERDSGMSIWALVTRLGWPIVLLRRLFQRDSGERRDFVEMRGNMDGQDNGVV